jgi:hypothetical protein
MRQPYRVSDACVLGDPDLDGCAAVSSGNTASIARLRDGQVMWCESGGSTSGRPSGKWKLVEAPSRALAVAAGYFHAHYTVVSNVI